jgi:hypothetical protein
MDPHGLQGLRWWDGTQWSPHTQSLPGISQQPQPSYPDATRSVAGEYDVFRQKSAGRHRQQRGPQDGTAYVRGLTPIPSLASSPSARLQTEQPPRGRQRRKKILITVALVVVALGITSRVVFRSGQADAGCWTESQDGTVVAESQVGQTCTDTARLITFPQDGGTYDNLSGPVSHPGTLICTVTAPSSESWKVWAEAGTDGQEAVGLCQTLHNPQMTAAGTWAVALLEGSNGQDETPPPSATATPTGTATPTPATATPAAAATMSAADYQASYHEAYNMTAEDYRMGQTPAIYHESYSQFCMTTIEASLSYPYTPAGTSGDPFYAGCMAALRAQQ